MKKQLCLLAFGIAFMAFSSAVYAQGFGGGGYTGPSLEPITIADLAETTPNQYVIVSGLLEQQRVPGRFILAEGEDEEKVSVIVRIGTYEWANLEVDGETTVWVYGIVIKSEAGLEILAERVGLPVEE
jgi:uncharacterized protein YdeI (BOF family)